MAQLGVGFIKVGHAAHIIDLALSIYALRLCPTFEMLFTGVKFWHRAQKIAAGRKTVHGIEPWLLCLNLLVKSTGI